MFERHTHGTCPGFCKPHSFGHHVYMTTRSSFPVSSGVEGVADYVRLQRDSDTQGALRPNGLLLVTES